MSHVGAWKFKASEMVASLKCKKMMQMGAECSCTEADERLQLYKFLEQTLRLPLGDPLQSSSPGPGRLLEERCSGRDVLNSQKSHHRSSWV